MHMHTQNKHPKTHTHMHALTHTYTHTHAHKERERDPTQILSQSQSELSWSGLLSHTKYYIINGVVRALNADWLTAVVYLIRPYTTGMTKHVFFTALTKLVTSL